MNAEGPQRDIQKMIIVEELTTIVGALQSIIQALTDDEFAAEAERLETECGRRRRRGYRRHHGEKYGHDHGHRHGHGHGGGHGYGKRQGGGPGRNETDRPEETN